MYNHKHASKKIANTFKRYIRFSKWDEIQKYEECLKSLSNHEKCVRIDINGKNKKTTKYFFDKNKYIYVKNKNDIKLFDKRNGGEIQNTLKNIELGKLTTCSEKNENKPKKEDSTIKNTDINRNNAKLDITIYDLNKNGMITKKERQLERSFKNFKDIYDLTKDEIIFMKFIEKIKIKHIFPLINNIRKNIYIEKNQEKNILNCIYKYLSYHCYAMRLNEFLFFLFIFPQNIKYSNKVIYYLSNIINKNQINMNTFINLIDEINLFHINVHINQIYINYLIRNIHKITIYNVFYLLTKGSYIFLVLPTSENSSTTQLNSQNLLFKNKLLQLLNEQASYPNFDDIKMEYLNFLSYNSENYNFYLHTFFNDIYISLYKNIILHNFDKIIKKNPKDVDFFKRIAALASSNVTINHMNQLLLNSLNDMNMSEKNTKKEIYQNTKIKVFPDFISQKDKQNDHSTMHSQQKNNDIKTENTMNFKKETNIGNKKLIKKNSTTVEHNNIQRNKFNMPNLTINSYTLEQKKKLILFCSPSDKIKSSNYSEVKEKYKIPTKITDKNIKIFLKFLKIINSQKQDYISNTILNNQKNNIYNTMLSMKKIAKNEKNISFPKTFLSFFEQWEYIKKGYIEDSLNKTNERKTIPYKSSFEIESQSHPPILVQDKERKKDIHSITSMQTNANCSSKERPLIPNESKINKGNLTQEKVTPNLFQHSNNKENNDSLCQSKSQMLSHNDVVIKEPIDELINSIYLNPRFKEKFYHKSQINYISKFFFYVCKSYEIYIKNSYKDVQTKEYKLLNDKFEIIFYEIFTYLLKSLNLINISNHLYLFISFSKYINLNEFHCLNLNNENRHIFNLKRKNKFVNILYAIHTIRKYQYDDVKDILQDKDNDRYLTFKTLCDETNKESFNLPTNIDSANVQIQRNHQNIQNVILENFDIDNVFCSKNKNMNSACESVKIKKNYKLPDCSYKNGTNSMNINISSMLEKYPLFSSFNYILAFLNNYLDSNKFNLNSFLVIIFYLEKIIPSSLVHLYHLESMIYKNHQNFINKYFYIFNGLNNSQTKILNKSYAIQIKKNSIQLVNDCIPSQILRQISGQKKNQEYNHRCNIFDNVENIFKKKKNNNYFFYSPDNTIKFFFLYSQNKIYHSSIYYDITKHLYKFNINNIDNNIAFIMFSVLIQCKHIYKPFLFSLLNLILNLEQTNYRNNLYILSTILLMLINQCKIKKKNKPHTNYIYIKTRFSKINWKYFFPIHIFVSKNVKFISNQLIKTFESNITSNYHIFCRSREKENCLNTSSLEPSIINLKNIEMLLKNNITKMVQQYKEYIEQDQKKQLEQNSQAKQVKDPLSYFYYLDKDIESDLFLICQNFLSYNFVTSHFTLPRDSLYYRILSHLKKNQKN
ncbi:conserved Plasmodium protein, unknown function [Plasmodium chabaudi chabaudi]|uniref:Uncharacterized protein n=1 Tax=Plasmodium chabaudi chabaudi TaxID=31271 RepID=A0A4V0K3G4_PLACU|nr:conserved Plasmodium protein, unknown function [Plasmodium chabaudi chabaudi]VTZ67078.1 conserved Plasmodium protein, unknown function [Plasmodium chabaudi chabaudi]|eukprot:XP_743145.2 conserved Plasmodium protein, unknown function [Plasmodium chabaudi chabaudi]